MNDEGMFTIRVYGILINGKGEVLLTDEFRLGKRMTKFPGGGLHYGEGPVDCLKREFLEEMQQEPFSIRHFYTTDYFQPTVLISPPRQLLSIYYLVQVPEPGRIKTTERPFDFEDVEGAQTFRWISLDRLLPADLTFPIDRKVAGLLLSEKKQGTGGI